MIKEIAQLTIKPGMEQQLEQGVSQAKPLFLRSRRCHGVQLFRSIEQVQHITEEWLREYNEQRPHDALGGLPPRLFMPRLTTAADSSSGMST